MASAPTVTIVKMLETLPEQLQDRVVEHVREYIEDLRDEVRWNESFSRTQESLVIAARLARKEITEGKANPLDIEKL
jgi:translation initiation factor 2B subunit (eIF-2B alpha/beta/delta family)